MADVNGCNLPDDLWYFPDKHVWLRPEPDGTITIGIDAVAMKLAGNVIVVTPKKVGRALSKGQSVATMESSKWVGPVPTPVSGELVAANDSVMADPKLLNEDPYANWIGRLRPTNWDSDKADLVSGPEGIERYRSLLVAEGITCA